MIDIMIDISSSLVEEARRRAGLTQRGLAALAGTSQPAIARLESGAVSPSLGTLQRITAAAGFELRATLVPLAPADPVIEAYKRDVDRTLLRENLKRTVDQRIRSLIELKEFGNELGRAGRKARRR
jgi:transcriptional regulator with XRE-family HTH domain